MKKLFYPMVALVVAVAAVGCHTDNVDTPSVNSVQTGEEITFGTALPEGGIETRTIYGTPDYDKREFPVYWVDGDEIAIFCPQASNPPSKLVHYTIGVSGDQMNTAETVTKIGDAGLQWGPDDLHKFYAFYPASYVKGTETTGLFHLNVPVTQQPLSFYTDSQGNLQAETDPDLAFMYAYRGQKKSNTPEGTDIDLRFTPLSTILEIVVQGPVSGDPVTLTSINVETLDGTPIVGDFTAQITTGSDEEESYESAVTCKTTSEGVVTDNLSVPCSWTDESGTRQFVKLEAGKKLYVRAFMLPTETAMDSKNIKVTVATTKGPLYKTLVSNGTSFQILPHKVNRVTLPALTTDYTVNYWMSSLDPDTYLTELSIPGSKLTNDGSYQPTSIEQQYKDGVRSFILHSVCTGYSWDYYLQVDGTNLTLKQAMANIASYLKAAEASDAKGENSLEFAVVQLTYAADSFLWGSSDEERQKRWVGRVQTEIAEMAADEATYRIYTKEVTPETTVSDVKGHIIVKANVNSDYMVTSGATAPVLYSLWKDPYGPTTTSGENYQDKFGGMPLYWQNYQAYNENSAGNSSLRWYYQEVTTVSNSGSNAEATYQSKINAIEKQFAMGVDLYNTAQHNTWLMNDIGGNKSDVRSGTTSTAAGNYSNGIQYSNGIEFIAAELNQLCLNHILNREEKAGLGLIFMNFANRGETGQKFQSDLILQTIIDNNFMFALRKKSTTSGTTAANYDAGYSNGGNAIGWDK